MGKTMKALLEETGPAILLTHSHSGQFGWETGMLAPELVKAIVAYEPGQHVFPEGDDAEEVFTTNPDVAKNLVLQIVSDAEFDNLTKMPILLIYGDNIRNEPSEVFNEEVWRVSLANAKQFVDAVNRHGGDATLIYLPTQTIRKSPTSWNDGSSKKVLTDAKIRTRDCKSPPLMCQSRRTKFRYPRTIKRER